MKHVVIVGCGVVGSACAYYLVKAGCKVTMIDQARFGMGCSHANCGFVSPSHVLPLAVPGAVGNTMKAMLHPDSPFSVRPGLNFGLWSWLLKFSRRCNTRCMEQSAQAIHALLQSSRKLYDDLIAQESLDVEWQTRGLLFVFQSPKAFAHHGESATWAKEHYGIEAVPYEGEAVCRLEPALKSGLAGGWHYPGDAHLRPDKLMTAWEGWLRNHGVEIRENCRLIDWKTSGQAVQSVTTSTDEIAAEHVILATGAWTPKLQQLLGCKIPIQPGKGYSMTMHHPNPSPQIPLLFEEHRVAATPFDSGYRLGSIMEFIGYDDTLNRRRLEFLTSGAKHYLHAPVGEPVVEEWWGWRPMTYDSVPIIGPVPAFGNVTLATGHSMLGLSMATGTGKLVSELILGQTPHVDPGAYAVTRF